jgi:hypothetical protein
MSLTPGRDLWATLDQFSDRDSNESIHSLVPHANNPVMRREHLAMFDLVPYAAVTHTAIQSGAWSDIRTWQGGRMPTAQANVLIPHDIVVTVNGEFDVALRTVRVDGTLAFDPTRSTALRVETLVVVHGGNFEMGTPDNPIARQVTAELRFVDQGPMDPVWDPFGLSGGLLVHGRATIRGAATTSQLALAVPPRAGDDVLTLTAAPVNWKVGDTLVLAGTSAEEAQDEELSILGVSGTRIMVTPLQFDHTPPREELQVHVAHITRNAVIRSESSQLDRRGHVMFMHTRLVDVAYAGFVGLGRTNKLVPVNDPVVDTNWELEPGTGLNARGRYPIHFHRNGVHDVGAPARVHGSVVVDAPGWGFVSHSSYVEFTQNVAYKVGGAAFATEAGDEIGAFRANFAIRTMGSGEDISSREPLQDFGHQGDGFWFQGPLVEVEGNIAAGHPGTAFVVYTRGLLEAGLGRAQLLTANLPDPSLALGASSVSVSSIPLTSFDGNIAYASHTGSLTRFHMLGVVHDQSSYIEDMLLWNNRVGMALSYSGQTVIRNAQIFGDFRDGDQVGIRRMGGTKGITIENARVEGYEVGIRLPREGDNVVHGGYFNNRENLLISTPALEAGSVRISGDIRFGSLEDTVLAGKPQRNIIMETLPQLATLELPYLRELFLPLTVTLDFGDLRDRRLYFHEQHADYIPFPKAGFSVPSEYVGKTNAQLWAEFQVAIGSELAPPDAVEVPGIVGLVGPA